MNPRLLLTVVTLGLVGHLLLHVGVIVDDAYISFRYARNLSEGLGLVYNVGEQVEGYTNFLWVLIAALGFELGIAPTLLMPPLGAACAIALLRYVQRSARELAAAAEQDGRDADAGAHAEQAPWAALILAASVGVAFYAVTGMETLLYTLLSTWALVSAARQRAVPFAIGTALAFLTRPEAGLLGLLGVGWLWLGVGKSRALARRAALRAALLMGAMLAPYLAFKLFYFGSLIPNTIAAKRPALDIGLRYVLEGYAPAFGLVLIVLWQLARTRRTGRMQPIAFVGFYFVSATLAVVLTGGDWMWAERMLVPALPALALCVDHYARAHRTARARALLYGALALYVGVSLYQSVALQRHFAGYMDADVAYADFGRELQASKVESLVAADIGILGYVAKDVRIIDLIGLVDRTIAHAPGGHGDKQIPIDYLASRDPQLVIIESNHPARRIGQALAVMPRQSTGQRLLESSWLRQHYQLTRSVRASYIWLHVYTRRRDMPPAPSATQDAAAR